MLIRKNKHAYFKYEVIKEYQAGVMLNGKQVKSIKSGEFEITDSFVKVDNNELYLWNILFASEEEKKARLKLLMHRKEIDNIITSLSDRKIHGFPLSVEYNNKNLIKFNIGLGRIKKVREKGAAEKRTSQKRELEREIKSESKYY